MPYTPPAYTAVDFDLMPSGASAYTPPAYNAVDFDLASPLPGGGGGTPGHVVSDNARLRNFAILLAI